MKTKQEIYLGQFTGSVNFYRHWIRMLYTDGVQYLAESADAYWLVDLVASYIPELGGTGARELLVYNLTVDKEKQTGKVIIQDGDKNELAVQEIPYTDFPLEEITLWAGYNGKGYTAMLPSEY